MAKSDFCFTFYDGDAARDMAHMNRMERGGYMDFIISQRKFGRITVDQIKKILGKDFDEIFGAISLILSTDESGKLYIDWLEKAENRAKKHAELQSAKGFKSAEKRTEHQPTTNRSSTKHQPKHNQNQTEGQPLGNGDGYGNEYEIGKGNGSENGKAKKQPDERINTLTAYLQENASITSLDGTGKENRQFCYLLLNRIKKEHPDKNEVDGIKLLIDAGLSDQFHSKLMTNFKYIYYNYQKIIKTQQNGHALNRDAIEAAINKRFKD